MEVLGDELLLLLWPPVLEVGELGESNVLVWRLWELLVGERSVAVGCCWWCWSLLAAMFCTSCKNKSRSSFLSFTPPVTSIQHTTQHNATTIKYKDVRNETNTVQHLRHKKRINTIMTNTCFLPSIVGADLSCTTGGFLRVGGTWSMSFNIPFGLRSSFFNFMLAEKHILYCLSSSHPSSSPPFSISPSVRLFYVCPSFPFLLFASRFPVSPLCTWIHTINLWTAFVHNFSSRYWSQRWSTEKKEDLKMLKCNEKRRCLQ